MPKFFVALLAVLILAPSAAPQEQKPASLPKPAADLQPGAFKYQVAVEFGSQKVSFTISTDIKDAGATWTVVNTMDTPQGQAKDTATLAKTSLVLEKRSLQQGSVDIEVSYADDKASGKFSMGGQDKPIAADLGGPVFADAAGSDQVIATLPLAIGYTAAFRNFDIQSQKVQLMHLSVPSIESIRVPAGTFDAFRVEVSSAGSDGEKKTVWIAKDSHKVVKVSAIMAAPMAGAVLTQELTQ